jgi:acyl carrier protein
MEERVKQIIAALFEISADEIFYESSPDTIENWDSIRHMNLVTALEEEFNIRLSDEQIGEMLNFQLVLIVLKENGVSLK